MHSNIESLEIRRLTKKDLTTFRSLIKMFNSVFEEDERATGSETNLQKLLDQSNFIVIAALSENEVIGGLTAYELPMYYSDETEILIYDMAVVPEYQRMGIGKRLIHKLKAYCIENEVKDFFVLAHEEDEHALEFYRSTGGRSEKVVNFVYEIGDDKG